MVRKIFVLILTVIMTFALVACGADREIKENNGADGSNDTSLENPLIVTEEELCGVYVSSVDDQFTVIFTDEEHTRDEDDNILTTPVYFCRRGEDKVPTSIYSWEIEGDVLNLTTWQGETIPYKIVKDGDSVSLLFLEDEYGGSSFNMPSPDNQAFLSDLIKESTEEN